MIDRARTRRFPCVASDRASSLPVALGPAHYEPEAPRARAARG